MKIVFMGTPDFAVRVLEKIIQSDNEVGLVVTQQDKAKDRGKKIQFTPVKECAIKYGIPVIQPEKVKENGAFFEKIKEYEPDIIVVVAYGKILPKNLLELPKYGCINVHASLLPKYRGASPIQHAIICGENETGVTIMQMADGIDTGDMLLKDTLTIGKMNYSQLHDALANMGASLAVEALDKIKDGTIVPEKQDDSKASYAKIILKQDGKIDFSKSPREVERLIRGFDPWPGAFCFYSADDGGQALMMKLWKAQPLDVDCSKNFGTIIEADDNGIKISCGGKILLVTEIQVPGKKRVSVKDYLRGNEIRIGQILK